MMLNKEDQHQLIHRIDDLYKAATRRGFPANTEFLGMSEATLAMSYMEGQNIPYTTYGGYDDAERTIIQIGKKRHDEEVGYPLAFIRITSLNNKFIKVLNHRDYLGAVMNLGIERRLIGDIIPLPQGCLIVCLDHILEYLMTNLVHVGNVEVSLEALSMFEPLDVIKNYQRIRNTVASLRLDSIVKICTNMSRSNSLALIKSGKVFVNGRETLKATIEITEGTVISVRGYGKFKVVGIGMKTKKDRTIVDIDKYI